MLAGHTQMDVYKSILKYCRSHDDDLDSELSEWESKLAHLLEDHPELAEEGSGSSDVEDSQGLDYQDLSDVPSSLPSEGLDLDLTLSILSSLSLSLSLNYNYIIMMSLSNKLLLLMYMHSMQIDYLSISTH